MKYTTGLLLTVPAMYMVQGGGVFTGGSRLSSKGEIMGADQGFPEGGGGGYKQGRIKVFPKGEGVFTGGSRISLKGEMGADQSFPERGGGCWGRIKDFAKGQEKKGGSPITGADQLILE